MTPASGGAPGAIGGVAPLIAVGIFVHRRLGRRLGLHRLGALLLGYEMARSRAVSIVTPWALRSGWAWSCS